LHRFHPYLSNLDFFLSGSRRADAGEDDGEKVHTKLKLRKGSGIYAWRRGGIELRPMWYMHG
ncbi:MAG: hypothetical protein ACFFAY_14855, partial [Promethearchaeota archaeon]